MIAMGAITLVVLAALTWWLANLEPAVLGVEREMLYTGTVQRGEMLRQVRGPGTLVPEVIQYVSAAGSGRVERIVELPGKAVTADTVILELSNPELEQQELDARLAVQAAKAEYQDLKVRLESQLLNQRADAARIEADYEEAKLEATANEELFSEQLLPEITLKKSRLREKQLAGRYEIEQERLDKTEESVQAQLASQRLRAEQLEAIADLRQSQIDGLVVRAGIDGVLQQVLVQEGQRVTAGTNLALVADPTQLKAELQIPQVQAKDLALEQAAIIDTRNGVVQGKVVRIDPAVRDGTVTVDVELTEPLPAGARPDLSIEGTIEIERLEDVLYVSRPSFGQPNARVEMFKVLDDGTAVRVPVQLGRSSVSVIEVVEGLQEGDEVILSSSDQYDDHDRIRLK
jgi:HlyD family secretion protein